MNLISGGILWITLRTIHDNELLIPTSIAKLGFAMQLILLAQFVIAAFHWTVSDSTHLYISNENKYSNNYLSIVYVILLLLNTVRIGHNIIQYKKRYNTSLANDILNEMLPKLSEKLKLNRQAQLLTTSRNISPFTKGILKPMIVFPLALLNQLSVAEMEMVLLHELAHIKRLDYLWNAIQLLLENILYFNPFVFLIGKIIRQNRELACDKMVLDAHPNAIIYAEALLHIAKNTSGNNDLALRAVSEKKSELKTRIENSC